MIVGRRLRIVVTAAVVALLLSPVVLDRDGFPLSTYPMYSRARPDVVSFVTAYGVGDDGARTRLSLAAVGASDDPLVVAGELRAAIDTGRADARCAEIAERVGRSGTTVDSGPVVAIEVVRERRDAVAQVTEGDGLLERRVEATCEVPT